MLTRSPNIGSSRIEIDQNFNSISVFNRFQAPNWNSLQTADTTDTFANIPGSVAFDPSTGNLYFADGVVWKQISTTGSVAGNATGYSFSKLSNQAVPNLSEVVLVNWSTGISPTFSTIPGWNLATGVYTATQQENVSFAADITWEPNFSTLGSRFLRVQYKPFGSGLWTNIKEAVTQPDPDIAIATTQEISTNAKLQTGDSIRLVVFQNSGTGLVLTGGIPSTLSGFKTAL